MAYCVEDGILSLEQIRVQTEFYIISFGVRDCYLKLLTYFHAELNYLEDFSSS
ncbi:unnamed protein product [Meloidogyne enterolobii]|uniref:Uncharacterized protein n=1 Tax=Meloidogyne enterolobii TaxID=390850 RepID=A0ACB0YWD4_MELEN